MSQDKSKAGNGLFLVVSVLLGAYTHLSLAAAIGKPYIILFCLPHSRHIIRVSTPMI